MVQCWVSLLEALGVVAERLGLPGGIHEGLVDPRTAYPLPSVRLRVPAGAAAPWFSHSCPSLSSVCLCPVSLQGFLTGVLQAYARCHHIPINALEFSFHHLSSAELPPPSSEREYQDDGVIVTDLWLEGASWDATHRVLREAEPGSVYCVRVVLL